MTDFLIAFWTGDLQWNALDQSRMNAILLILFGGIILWFLRREANRINERIEQAVNVGQQAVDEIRELRLNEREHKIEIQNLKEDVDTLFGRPRTKRHRP